MYSAPTGVCPASPGVCPVFPGVSLHAQVCALFCQMCILHPKGVPWITRRADPFLAKIPLTRHRSVYGRRGDRSGMIRYHSDWLQTWQPGRPAGSVPAPQCKDFQQLGKAPVSQVLLYFMVQEPWLHRKTQSLSWPSLTCFPGQTPDSGICVCMRGKEGEGRRQTGEVGPAFPAKSWAPLGPLSWWPQGSLGRRMRAVPSPSLSL